MSRARWRSGALIVMALALAATGAAGPGVPTAPAAAGPGVGVAAPQRPASALPSPIEDPFYEPPEPLSDVAPGTVLRSRAVTVRALVLPFPVRAWQVLYRSSTARGEPNAVSGTVLVPATTAAGPRPVVSYAVGSHGLGQQCAPSYQLHTGQEPELGLISQALGQGWAVVVTDYEGLGTPGPHTYGAGRSAGHAVLDAARAATALPEAGLDPDAPVGIWGYSEGGQAAGWAGQLHPSYAPDLGVRGVAAGGTPADLEPLVRYLDGGPLSGFVLGGGIGLARAYPDVPFAEILTPAGAAAVADASTLCVAELVSRYSFRRLADYTTVADPVALPQWQRVLAANRLGATSPTAPVLLYHGTLDEFVPFEIGRQLFRDYCELGVTVDWRPLPLLNHFEGAGAGGPVALPWLAQRFAGVPTALTSCS